MLRHIHHRVQNTLQVIISLLGMQADDSKDPKVRAALGEAESRVRAIAQVHESLNSSNESGEVEFGAYLTHLTRELVAVHAAEPEQIEMVLEVRDMALRVKEAVPLGLIANELILHSVKHGFKEDARRLEVRLSYAPDAAATRTGAESEEAWARLEIRHGGSELPAWMNDSEDLGPRLVNLLVGQLRGRLETGAAENASVTVVFPLKDD